MQTEQDDHLFPLFAGDSLLQDNKKKKKELHCASKHISLKVNHVGDILAYFYNHIADH